LGDKGKGFSSRRIRGRKKGNSFPILTGGIRRQENPGKSRDTSHFRAFSTPLLVHGSFIGESL
jgi:hypothetical protein